MRVALVGGRSFGAAVLHRLADYGRTEIVAVWCEDGDKMEQAAHERVGAIVNLRGSGDPARFLAERADVLLSVHNHVWLSEAVCEAPRYGTIGYHPSLLPRHRGKDAVRWTIHMGDPIAGGSIYRLEGDRADTGRVLLQDWCHVVPGWTASELWAEALFPMGVRLLAKAVSRPPLHFQDLMREAREQDERVATWEPAWVRPTLKDES